VDKEAFQFLLVRDPVQPRLNLGALQRYVDLPQQVVVAEVEGEYVGGLVLSPVLPVQLADQVVGAEDDRGGLADSYPFAPVDVFSDGGQHRGGAGEGFVLADYLDHTIKNSIRVRLFEVNFFAGGVSRIYHTYMRVDYRRYPCRPKKNLDFGAECIILWWELKKPNL